MVGQLAGALLGGTGRAGLVDDDVAVVRIGQVGATHRTGHLDERGVGDAVGTTINVPLPAGATGDVARASLDEVIVPVIADFAPDWLFVSAGYDGHRADPITDLGYTSADIGDLMATLQGLAPANRTVVVLEGGYDLDAVRDSSAAVVAQLLGESHRPEAPTSGGPGLEIVAAARRLHRGER